jgi:hypothetical protein
MRQAIALLMVLALLPGCTSLGNQAPHPPRWPLASASNQAPSVSLYCRLRGYVLGADGQYTIDFLPPSACWSVFATEMEQSGLFSKVYNGTPGGQLRMELTTRALTEPPSTGNMMAMICSVGLWPMMMGKQAYIETQIFDASGRKIDDLMFFERQVAYMAMWDLLIPALWPGPVERAIVRATLAEAVRRGSLHAL